MNTSDENTLIIDITNILQTALQTFDTHPGVTLSNSEVVFINQLMKESPQSFQDVSSQINSILEKREIEISDIPHLLYIIASIYIKDFRYKNINIIACIQYTLETIIDSGVLPINKYEEKLLKTVIETSLNLLKMNLPLIEDVVEEVVEEVVEDAEKVVVCFKKYICFC